MIETRCTAIVACYIAPMAKSMSMKQLELPIPQRGGARRGAGRPRTNARDTVAHVKRETFDARHPVQVTMRLCDGIPSLRERPAWAVIVRVMRALRERGAGFRVVHYTVLWNHIHAIVEADRHATFVAGMRALTIRLARALDEHFDRKGRCFDHRYDACVLGCPTHVRHALQYVLLNARKHAAEHGVTCPADWIDERSTGVLFDGWATLPRLVGAKDFGTSPAQTWSMNVGWRKRGLIHIDAVPGDVGFDSANVRRAA